MNPPQPSKYTLLVAWIIVLLSSSLPKIILQEIFGLTVTPNVAVLMSLGVVFAALLAALLWRPLRGLGPLVILIAVLVVTQWLVYNHLDRLPFYHSWLGNSSFNVYMLAEQSLNLIVMLVMIAALLLMKKKRQDFYLARGDLAAPVAPIRWLGVKQGDRWNKFGAWLTFIISLGTLAFLFIAGRPPVDIVVQALPFLPAVLLAAAVNAFTEEIT